MNVIMNKQFPEKILDGTNIFKTFHANYNIVLSVIGFLLQNDRRS